jgi:hypothetical protein
MIGKLGWRRGWPDEPVPATRRFTDWPYHPADSAARRFCTTTRRKASMARFPGLRPPGAQVATNPTCKNLRHCHSPNLLRNRRLGCDCARLCRERADSRRHLRAIRRQPRGALLPRPPRWLALPHPQDRGTGAPPRQRAKSRPAPAERARPQAERIRASPRSRRDRHPAQHRRQRARRPHSRHAGAAVPQARNARRPETRRSQTRCGARFHNNG